MYKIVEAAQGLVQFLHDAPAQYAWQFQTGQLQVNGGPIVPALHLVGGGSTPTGTGSAHASFTSIVGTDLAGRVFITNDGSPATGAQGIVLFANAFAAAPYVVVTPVSASTGTAFPFVTSSTNSFTYATGVAPVVSGTFGFNYIANG